jgi:hypothetical protein
MAQLISKEKTIFSILLVTLLCVFAFAGTMPTVVASPAQFTIVYTLEWYEVQTILDNELFHIFEQSQTGFIKDSTILLDDDIIGADIYFDWLAVHNKQSDVARAWGTFEIITSGGVVLITGTTMARVRGFTSFEPVVEVKYFGSGYVNLWGTTEDIGFNIDITIEGHYR